MTRAIAYVPSAADDFDQHADRCMNYCRQKGYKFLGLISDDWSSAERMMGDGQTSVVIVSRPDHVDPDRKPRIEVANRDAVQAVPPRNDGPVPKRLRRPNQV